MEIGIYILKSAGVLSLFYLVYHFFLRNDTLFQIKRHYLLTGFLISLFLPFVVFTKTTLVEIPPIDTLAITDSFIYESGTPIIASAAPSTSLSIINWKAIGLLTYCMGMFIVLFRFIFQLYSLSLLISKGNRYRKSRYVYTKVFDHISPFSFFRYIVFNEKLHTKEDLEMIFKHEEIHAHQLHSVDLILANLMTAIFWFNPLVWMYKKRIEENLEFIADSETIQQIPSKREYQLALVKATSGMAMPALTNQFYQSFIKKRIVMLNKKNSKKLNSWKTILILPLLALFLWSFNVQEVIEYQEKEQVAQDVEISANEAIVASASEVDLNTEMELAVVTETATSASNNVVISTEIEKPETAVVLRTNYAFDNSSNPIVASSFNDSKFKITKNSSDSELEAIKQKLEAEGIEFKYSGVKRNSSGEITAIKIKYKSQSGNSGNYQVSDDDGIENFYFESGNNGTNVKFYTEGNEDRMRQRLAAMEVRRGELKERRAVMEIERKERREEMKERREGMSKRMKAQEKRLHKRMKKLEEKRSKLRGNDDRNTFILHSEEDDHEDVNVWVSSGGKVVQHSGNNAIIHSDNEEHEDGNVIAWTSKGSISGSGGKYKIAVHEDDDHDQDEEHEHETIEIRGRKGVKTIQRGSNSTVIIEDADDGHGYLYLDIDGDEEPYILKDGKEYKGKLSDISPKDIEKVEVVKGEGALKYGEKGKNGVVLITTKKD